MALDLLIQAATDSLISLAWRDSVVNFAFLGLILAFQADDGLAAATMTGSAIILIFSVMTEAVGTDDSLLPTSAFVPFSFRILADVSYVALEAAC